MEQGLPEMSVCLASKITGKGFRHVVWFQVGLHGLMNLCRGQVLNRFFKLLVPFKAAVQREVFQPGGRQDAIL